MTQQPAKPRVRRIGKDFWQIWSVQAGAWCDTGTLDAGRIGRDMEAAYQQGVQEGAAVVEKLRAALQAITEPAGSNSEYGLLYLWNIIEWCRKTARDALNLVHDDDSEGVRA